MCVNSNIYTIDSYPAKMHWFATVAAANVLFKGKSFVVSLNMDIFFKKMIGTFSTI